MSPFALRKGRRFGFAALLRRTADIRPEEITPVFWCWIYIFCVLSSYYVMRPIREQMGVAGGVANLPWLFTATLAGMLVANLPFALLVQRLPGSRFVPLVYRFFGLNILGFAAALHLSGPDQALWIGRAGRKRWPTRPRTPRTGSQGLQRTQKARAPKSRLVATAMVAVAQSATA